MSYNISRRIREEITRQTDDDTARKLALDILLFEIENWKKELDFRAKYEKMIHEEIGGAEE